MKNRNDYIEEIKAYIKDCGDCGSILLEYILDFIEIQRFLQDDNCPKWDSHLVYIKLEIIRMYSFFNESDELPEMEEEII